MTAPVYPAPKPSSEHEKLQDEICKWLKQWHTGWIPVTELDMGSRSMDREIGRADIFAMSVTYPPRFIICEVKVSRADFLSDMRSDKYLDYIYHCDFFYFATPHGLITKDDLPQGCGWLEQYKNKKGFSEYRGEDNRYFNISTESWHAFAKRLGR